MARIMPTLALALVSGLVAMAAPVSPAWAQKARQLSDLIGARAAGAESDLEARGYTYITGHSSDRYTKMDYWWSGRERNCVRVEVGDGRVQSLVDTTAGDCNQKEKMSSGDKAAVAMVGAALLAAAISHKSGHHNDGKHYSSQDEEADYERGFSDGLHNTSYHNYDRTNAYSDGYEAGVAQRNRGTSYHSGAGGYSQAPRYRDLVGVDGVRAFDMMAERGFRSVDSLTSGNTQYGIYYHPASRLCVQLTMADGRVVSADDIHSHPKCH